MASSKRLCWASEMPRLCCRSGLVLSRSIAVWNSTCASGARPKLRRTSPSVLWYWALSGSSCRASLREAMPSASTRAAVTRSGPRAPPSLDRVVSPLLAFMVVPTYEYECPKCPRIFEVKQRITEPKLEVCEICGGPIHRLLSATPFILKGGGWYVTDYPSESRKKASKSESTSGDSAPAAPSPAAEKSSTSQPAPSHSEKAKS